MLIYLFSLFIFFLLFIFIFLVAIFILLLRILSRPPLLLSFCNRCFAVVVFVLVYPILSYPILPLNRIQRLTRLAAEEDGGATELGVTFTDTSWFTSCP